MTHSRFAFYLVPPYPTARDIAEIHSLLEKQFGFKAAPETNGVYCQRYLHCRAALLTNAPGAGLGCCAAGVGPGPIDKDHIDTGLG